MAINILCIWNNATGKIIGMRRANGLEIMGHIFPLVRFIGENDLLDHVTLMLIPPHNSKSYKAGDIDVRGIWNVLNAKKKVVVRTPQKGTIKHLLLSKKGSAQKKL